MINKTSLRKSKKENSKGITLIALVITIIVLLILAGVSIATLTGENGILTKANTAKNQTIEAEEKEQISLAYSTVMADKLHSNSGNDLTVTADELGKALVNQNAGATVEKDSNPIKVTFTKSKNVYTVDVGTGEITGNGGSQTPTEEFNTAETVEDAIAQDKPFKKETPIKDSDNKVVTIPAGFKIASDSANLVAEGVVIEDTTGNQFVWVPVDDINNFKRIEGYFDGSLESILANCTEPSANGYSTEQAEYDAMYDSVKNNKGFYIGRFEAGKDRDRNVVVKKGVDVYNNVPWGNSMSDISQGAVKLAKEFAEKNKYQGVTSTLCYGVQWDATLKFIDPGFTGFAKDSSKQGWYSDNYNKTDSGNIETNPSHITGKDLIYNDKPTVITNKQKNIYDMAGNVKEWTMEAYNSSYNGYRVYRGGFYDRVGSGRPASGRGDLGGPGGAYDDSGFRVALYL